MSHREVAASFALTAILALVLLKLPPSRAGAHPERTFVLAFQALPLILVVSVLSAVLFH